MIRHLKTVLLPLLPLTLLCSSALCQTARAASASGGNAQDGKRLYTSYGCYECHGREGQGSTLSGPRVGPDPIAFSAFVNYIRQPKGQMPPYTGKVLSDAEIADIYAFLKSLPKPLPVGSNGQLK